MLAVPDSRVMPQLRERRRCYGPAEVRSGVATLVATGLILHTTHSAVLAGT